MKTDLYTKSVLTVIAVALGFIALENFHFTNEAKAEHPDFNKFATVPVNSDGSINVKVVSDMDVNIHSIGGSSIYGSLPINLKEIGGSSFYGNLPVNIKEISGSSFGTYGMPVDIKAVNGQSIYSAVPVKESK
jgi:hypothetical protein